MPYRVIDVVLHVADGHDRMMTVRPIRTDTDLGHGVRLAPIDRSVSEKIIELCNPQMFRHAPSRQLIVRY